MYILHILYIFFYFYVFYIFFHAYIFKIHYTFILLIKKYFVSEIEICNSKR